MVDKWKHYKKKMTSFEKNLKKRECQMAADRFIDMLWNLKLFRNYDNYSDVHSRFCLG